MSIRAETTGGKAVFTFGGESGISITSGISEGTVTRTYTLTETGAPAGL